MKYNTFPPSGGLKMVVVPSLFSLSEGLLAHSDILWVTYKQAMYFSCPDDIPKNVRHVVIDNAILSEFYLNKIVTLAFQCGVDEVYAVNEFKRIKKWAEALLASSKPGRSLELGARPKKYDGENQMESRLDVKLEEGKKLLVLDEDINTIHCGGRDMKAKVEFWGISEIKKALAAPLQADLANIQSVAIVASLPDRYKTEMRRLLINRRISDIHDVSNRGVVTQYINSLALLSQVRVVESPTFASSLADVVVMPPKPQDETPDPAVGGSKNQEKDVLQRDGAVHISAGTATGKKDSLTEFVRKEANFFPKFPREEIQRLVDLALSRDYDTDFKRMQSLYYQVRAKHNGRGNSNGDCKSPIPFPASDPQCAPQVQANQPPKLKAEVLISGNNGAGGESLAKSLDDAIRMICDGQALISKGIKALAILMPEVAEVEKQAAGTKEISKAIAALTEIQRVASAVIPSTQGVKN